MGLVAAALGLDGAVQRSLALAGDDVDHPAYGGAAIEPGLRPAQNLDALDIAQREQREIEFTRGLRRIVDADAVDHHLRMVGIGAANIDVRGAADAAGLVHGEAGDGLQQLGDVFGARGFDLVAADHRDRAAHLAGGFRAAVGGDDDLVEQDGLLRARRSMRRCGAQQKGAEPRAIRAREP